MLVASSLEGYFSFDYQTWNDGMTDVHRPPTLTLHSRTGAAKPTLWPSLNPCCHFTVPCFIFKTKTFSFSSKQALSNSVFGVKIGRTTKLPWLFKVINFWRSKFVYARYRFAQSLDVRGRPGNTLHNAGLPRCTHPDSNSASRLLSGKAMISWPARAVRHEGGQMKKKKGKWQLGRLRSARSEDEPSAIMGENRAERQMIGWPSRAARTVISWPARAVPFSHSQIWE